MKVLKPVKFNTPVTGQFIRGSTATYIEDGILKTAVGNEPRWQDGQLLMEGAATNLVANNSMIGASVGSPGVLPTGWSTATSAGITRTVVGVGVELGVQYVDIRFSGTNTSGSVGLISVLFGNSSNAVPAALGSTWTPSVYLKIVGGSLANLSSAVIAFYEKTAANAFVRTASGQLHTVTASLQRFASPATVQGATTAFVDSPQVYFSMGVGASVDITLRVGFPQFEAGAAATSVIPTTTTPATRAADICVGNFSRASTATYIDASGVIQTAAINIPRIQNNKLLIEPASTNLATWSETFTTGWSVFNATTSTTTTSPTGVNTARQLNETATTNEHGTSQTVTMNGANKTFTASVFAKARTRENFHFELGQISGGKCVINTNLTTGVQTKVTAGFDGETYGIQFIGNGWYRIWITAKLVSSNSPYIQLKLSTDGVTTNYAGVAGNGIDIFGGQLEESTTLTSYIPTTNTAVTRSADLHTAGIVYSNAVESTASWSSATTYSIGQKVRYNNTIYESLQGTNLNKQPDTNPTWWLSLGADNISAAIDGKVGTKTVAIDKLRMIVYPDSAIDAVGYVECSANSISTSVVDTNYNLVYSYETGLSNELIDNWYDYFFIDPLGDPFTQVVHQGVNSLDPKVVIGIEMTRSGSVELGLIVTGQTTEIGKTQYGLKAGIVDYSRKQADEFGNIVLVERTYSKRLEGDVYVYNYDLNKVQRFLYNIRATPVLWIASDDPELAEVSNVYGFYKDFSTTISYPDVSMCSLQIEGLT